MANGTVVQLTDNEKAATYIGWVPTTNNCAGYGIRHSQSPHYRCPCGFSADEYGLHGMTAGVYGYPDSNRSSSPDMTDPRNYMKALEGQISELIRDYEGWHCSLAKNEIPEGSIAIINWHKTAGEAVTAAFTALYNAEHQETL